MERSNDPSRRRRARVAAHYPITIALPHGTDRIGTTLDLSADGLSLCTAQAIAPGSRCTLRLELPSGSGLERLQLEARSIYSSYSAPGNFKIGMVFVGLDAETEARIVDLANGSRAPRASTRPPGPDVPPGPSAPPKRGSMSTCVIDFADSPKETRERRLRDLPDRVEEGDPRQVTEIQFDEDGLLAGVWTSTPGRWRAFTDRDEFCSILSGHCRLIHQDGTVKEFRAGDAFLVPNGFRGWWEVVTTTTKRFVIRNRPAS